MKPSPSVKISFPPFWSEDDTQNKEIHVKTEENNYIVSSTTKIQLLILEAAEHFSEGQDILGRISHLIEGVDVRDFCSDDMDEVEAKEICRDTHGDGGERF